MNFTKKLLSVW